MSLALFPLGAIALWQTNQVVDTTVQLSNRIILSETERAAASERRLLERGRGATEGLAALIGPVVGNAAQCSQAMERFIRTQDLFVFAGFIDATGQMDCASNGVSADFSETDSFARAMERRQPMFEVNLSGAATGKSVVIVSQPVDVDGTFAGFISLSAPHDLTDVSELETARSLGMEYVTLNRAGRILSSTNGMDTAGHLLPTNVRPEDFVDRQGDTFSARAIDGRERLFAVASIIPDEVAVVGSWPTGRVARGGGAVSVWLPLLFPILMWFAGIAVAFLGLHRLVIRHIYHLRGAMRRFALGERDAPRLTLNNPPAEFEVLETSFNRMVLALMHAEAQAEKDLDEKTILLREIHHRVKNNLQLIASIMNMHARAATAPEARAVLAQLQLRVRGLATVHQTLNATSHDPSIDAQIMLERLVKEMAPLTETQKREIHVTTNILSVQLGQDQAVTLAMLAAETLTNAVKYIGGPSDTTRRLDVTFTRVDDTTLRFCVVNSIGAHQSPGVTGAGSGGGVGSRLIRAFVAQLNGKDEREETDTHYRFAVTFPLAPVTGATDPALARQIRGRG
ncbi:sensor histidine kinase [uncultured Tateyamaria sp.]|uniref:sensor histidine kinase n=1 Tax=uncultured Tateyamaria sp. TaxID=455651 RepID=UPI002606ADF3|nr:sensor histidine kinase [uncultured Tateyamaria sp.]